MTMAKTISWAAMIVLAGILALGVMVSMAGEAKAAWDGECIVSAPQNPNADDDGNINVCGSTEDDRQRESSERDVPEYQGPPSWDDNKRGIAQYTLGLLAR